MSSSVSSRVIVGSSQVISGSSHLPTESSTVSEAETSPAINLSSLTTAVESTISAAETTSSFVSSVTASHFVPVYSTLPPLATTTPSTSHGIILYPNFIITLAALILVIVAFKRTH